MSVFSSVVVGVDGGAGGRDALALARVLAPEAEVLTLLHVGVLAPAYTAVADQLQEEAIQHELDGMAADLRARAAGGTVHTRRSLAVTVAEGLADAARAQDADLIVVGSSRRGRMARILLGDDTRAVLRRAPCPVAVAPSGQAAAPGAPPTSIALGFDADRASERALTLALALRPDTGTITAVHVEPPPSLGLPLSAVGVYSVPARAAALAAAERVVAGVAGADRSKARLGRVCDGLLDLATHADLLIVGLHHRSPLGRLLRGSTAEDLLRELPCPLLAVPED
jgi:nucleotide-binding universal stress UspA family protein